MIRIGCCIPGGSFMPQGEGEIPLSPAKRLLGGYRGVKDLGYDAVETTVGMIMGLTEEDMDFFAEQVRVGAFSLVACNSFIPGEYPVITDDAGTKRLYDYAERVFARLERLGVKLLVFGSGFARRIPDGADRAAAEEQLDRFLIHCNTLCEKHCLTLLIEPLNRAETNWCCSVGEGAAVVKRLSLPHIRLLADGFHMAKEGEDLSVLAENRDIILHTHLACPPERIYPGATDGIFETAFLKVLSDMDYDGCVTVECSFFDFAGEAHSSAEFLKKTLGALV